MRHRVAVAVGLALLAGGAVPATGQTWKVDFGVNGGGSWWTAFTDEETAGGNAAFETSWLIGAQATGWFWPRVGLRLNFPYEDRALEARDGTLVTPSDAEHINIWGPTLDLLLRLKRPSESYVKGEFLPYLALGGGIRYVNPAGDGYTALDEPNEEFWTGVPFSFSGSTAPTMFLSELSTPMGLVGLGADWRLASSFGLRFEVGDRISKPYAYAVTPRTDPLFFDAVDGRENDASLSHEVYGTVGLHWLLGGAREEAVAVAPPPPPPAQQPPPTPPAQQPPPPPPPPAEESMSVCVVDATSAAGVRNVTVTYLPATRDSLVTVNGQRVAFRTTVGDVPVAANADWLIAGRPLEVAVTPGPARFLPVGQTRTISDGLVRLGTVGGLTVYAERSAIGDAQFGQGGVLTTVLRDATLRRAFDEVQTLYVPYRAVGCVFQPLQRQEEVRKAR